MAKQALGRGIDALFSGIKIKDGEEVIEMNINLIQPNPYQPRQREKEEDLEELKQSIKEKGILLPLIVTEKDGNYFLVAGERRWRAALSAGLTTVPVVLRKVEENEMLELALIENLQRKNLNSVEEAEAYLKMKKLFSLTQEEVASRVGKSRSYIANILRLLNLPPEILQSIQSGEITFGHAKALLMIENEEIRYAVWKKILKEGLSVRETEAIAKGLKVSHLKEKTKAIIKTNKEWKLSINNAKPETRSIPIIIC